MFAPVRFERGQILSAARVGTFHFCYRAAPARRSPLDNAHCLPAAREGFAEASHPRVAGLRQIITFAPR